MKIGDGSFFKDLCKLRNSLIKLGKAFPIFLFVRSGNSCLFKIRTMPMGCYVNLVSRHHCFLRWGIILHNLGANNEYQPASFSSAFKLSGTACLVGVGGSLLRLGTMTCSV